MNSETAAQNLEFFSNQAKKFRKRGRISDEDMHRFAIEIEEFKHDVKHSKLPSDIKKEIAALDLAYTDTKTSAGGLMMTISTITLGVAIGVFFLSRRSKRKAYLELLRTKADMLSEKISLANDGLLAKR